MIKAGYAIEITSWENDADCYNTKRIDGLSLEECRWRCAFIKYYAENIHQVELDYTHTEALYAFVPASYIEGAGYSVPEDESERHELVCDLVYQMFGFAYESDRTRVCESWAVYFIQSPINQVNI